MTFTFTDMFADFGVRREFEGQGFSALYENLKETQTARIRMRIRFLRGFPAPQFCLKRLGNPGGDAHHDTR